MPEAVVLHHSDWPVPTSGPPWDALAPLPGTPAKWHTMAHLSVNSPCKRAKGSLLTESSPIVAELGHWACAGRHAETPRLPGGRWKGFRAYKDGGG